MKKNPLNGKILAVVCGTVLFLGMSMMTYAQQEEHRRKKHEEVVQQQDRMLFEQRQMEYRQHLQQQQQLTLQNMAQLQHEKRMSQYRYRQHYSEQMNQQWRRYDDARIHSYPNDPFFKTGFDRRYNRGGVYYKTNRYGVEHINQAIQYGYSEGFQAGKADREDHWRSDYERCDAYRDANYGYNGYYVSQDDYNYYFREGFRRGYEDGYNRHYRYGRFSNGRYSIFDNVLRGIISFEMLR
jgi:hypothetical protein